METQRERRRERKEREKKRKKKKGKRNEVRKGWRVRESYNFSMIKTMSK